MKYKKKINSEITEMIYRRDLARAMAGINNPFVEFSEISRNMYHCKKCSGDYVVLRVVEDKTSWEGFRERSVVLKCKNCGDEVDAGIGYWVDN